MEFMEKPCFLFVQKISISTFRVFSKNKIMLSCVRVQVHFKKNVSLKLNNRIRISGLFFTDVLLRNTGFLQTGENMKFLTKLENSNNSWKIRLLLSLMYSISLKNISIEYFSNSVPYIFTIINLLQMDNHWITAIPLFLL
jgi:hypothetical protein